MKHVFISVGVKDLFNESLSPIKLIKHVFISVGVKDLFNES